MGDLTFNLLDPCVCSIDFSQQDKDNDKICMNILNSSNQDKDYEFFWLTFKNSVIPYLGKNAENIKKFSSKLNELQKKLKSGEIEKEVIREEISDYMYDNINMIAIHILYSSCFVTFMRFNINLMRWGKIDEDFAYDITDPYEFEWVNNIRVLGKMGIKKHQYRKYILEELKKVHTTKNYGPLFEFGIKNNLSSIVEMCGRHIDMCSYFNETDAKRYKNAKGNKLIKLLKDKI